MSLRYDIESIGRWIISPASRELTSDAFLRVLSERLCSAGIPIWRSTASLRTMHPEVYVEALEWRAGEGVTPRNVAHATLETPFFTRSPVSAMVDLGAQGVRCRLERPREEIPYPVCRELADEGATDYLLIQLPASPPSLATFTTKEPGGFTREQIFALNTLTEPFAARIELATARHTTASLLKTYLGPNAAGRVLHGKFKRGGGEKIKAAIWMSDLRGFTRFVDKSSFDTVMPALDTYFGCVADAIHKEGGEVLKFIGDAVLAVFAVGQNDDAAVARAAVRAAEAAFEELDEVNARRKRANSDPLDFGVAVHFGEVMYGNIGSKDRLDFTVIGSSVNETSRLESQCKELGTSLIISKAVADFLDPREVTSLGKVTLRGVSEPVEVFTLERFRPSGP